MTEYDAPIKDKDSQTLQISVAKYSIMIFTHQTLAGMKEERECDRENARDRQCIK
jgi:hypothetical protein